MFASAEKIMCSKSQASVIRRTFELTGNRRSRVAIVYPRPVSVRNEAPNRVVVVC